MADGSGDYANGQAVAASESGNAVGGGCEVCHEGNWIHVRYEYTEGDAVTDAVFVVQTPNGGEPGGDVIAEGVVTIGPDAEHDFVHVDLGDHSGEVEVFFLDDPTEPVPYEEDQPVKDERNWFQRAADGVAAGASWTWDVVQGDFNEDMTTGQIITNAVVTAIPVVDQVADLRDLIANGKALIWDRRYAEVGVWVGIVACLIGLVPSLGSLAKGVIKLIWKNASEIGRIIIYINKALYKSGRKINGYRFVKDLADQVVAQVPFVVRKFGEFLDEMAEKIALARSLAPERVAGALAWIEELRGMSAQKIEEAAQAIRRLILGAIAGLAVRAHRALPSESLIIRRATQAVLEMGPFPSWMRGMGREGFDKTAMEAGARQMDDDLTRKMLNVRRNAPRWKDELLADPKLPPSLRAAIENDPDRFVNQVLPTFGGKPTYREFGANDKIYRVVNDEKGFEGQFWSPNRPPASEAEWRARDAVLNDWNNGGAFIVVEVPPPPAAFVGEIGPQDLTQVGKSGMALEGGGTQIWLPRDYPTPAVDAGQIKEYWFTEWNAPTAIANATRRAANWLECDL